MRRTPRLACAVPLALALVVAAPARADDVADEAELQFNLGAEAYQKGDYTAALEHFLASNRLVRNRNVLFNIAKAYEKKRKFPEAYRYYLRAREGETDAQTRASIEQALQAMSANVALLRVETDPPGARVFLDRKDLGERGNAPLALGLDEGTYRVIAELAGYEDAVSAPLHVRVGAEDHVRLQLVRILGTVRLEGDARGQVRLDAEDAPPLGVAPGDVQIPPGRHTLFVTRAGYQTAQVNVDVRARQLVVARPSMVARTGTVIVNADEHDALIEVDGEPRGFTPAVVTVPVGTHRVRVALRGFRTFEQPVTLAQDQQVRLEVQLVAAEQVEAASRAIEAVEDAPSSVSIVPNQELRAMQYPHLAEALRGVRGIFVSDDRGYASLGFRGFGRPGDYGNRTLVLLDGQPMNDDWLWSSYVGYDLRTDLEDIERIEVVRGPGSVLYGTSAFSGVVNMVTRSKDVPTSVEVGTSVSDYSLARGRARVTYRISKDSGVWVSGAAGHGGGRDFYFPELAGEGPPAVAGNARGMDGVDMGTLGGRFWTGPFTVQWSLHSHRKQLPTGEFSTMLGDNRTVQTDSRGMVEAKLEPKLGPKVESLTRLHGNWYQYRGQFAHQPDQGDLENVKYDGYWTGLEQRFAFVPSRAVRLTVGGEAQIHFYVHQYGEDQQQRTYLNDDHPFQVGAGYVLADVTPSKEVKISAGARLDYYSTFGSSMNPRLALIFHPYEAGTLKVMSGKAFRAPSIYELFYTAGGGQLTNPKLQPEDIYSAELEYAHRLSPTVTATAAAYVNYITGLIALKPYGADSLSYQYQNTPEPVETVGAELELRREWKEGWMLGATLSVQRSQYLGGTSIGDVLSLSKDPSHREVPNSPPYLASLKGAVPLLSRALTAMTRFSVEGPRFDRNDDNRLGLPPQTRTDPAILWDLVFSGGEPRWGLRYALGFYNLFDWRWVAPVSVEFRQITVPQNGRTVMATASLTL